MRRVHPRVCREPRLRGLRPRRVLGGDPAPGVRRLRAVVRSRVGPGDPGRTRRACPYLHTALLEAALEAAQAGERPADAVTDGGDCPDCEMPLLADAMFCVA